MSETPEEKPEKAKRTRKPTSLDVELSVTRAIRQQLERLADPQARTRVLRYLSEACGREAMLAVQPAVPTTNERQLPLPNTSAANPFGL